MFFVVILYGNIKKHSSFLDIIIYISNIDFMEGLKLINVVVIRLKMIIKIILKGNVNVT